jgi:uncharacterized RDD family membrane protein YckC
MQYAAFMRRVGAFLIDLLIVPILWLAALFGIGLAFGLVAGFLGTSEETDERFLDTLIGPLAVVLMAAVPILYAAVLEAGAGGTVGKLLLKIHVASADGSRLRFGRALVRSVGKLFSTIFFGLGFLPAAFTERHQAMHDFIAGTVVLRGPRERKGGEPVLGPPGERAEEPVMVTES